MQPASEPNYKCRITFPGEDNAVGKGEAKGIGELFRRGDKVTVYGAHSYIVSHDACQYLRTLGIDFKEDMYKRENNVYVQMGEYQELGA